MTWFTHIKDISTHTRFPSGEWHVELREDAPLAGPVIAAPAVNFDDLARIKALNTLLVRSQQCPGPPVWFIPLFPFGRYDRREHSLDGFELELALEFMADVRILTADPHSHVLHGPNMWTVPQRALAAPLLRTGEYDAVLIPDEGARKKADWVQEFPALAVAHGYKSRDPRTGKLTGFHIANPENLAGKHVLMYDDICDGGGTFVGLAEQLKATGTTPASLTLATTHGLYTKGHSAFTGRFQKVISYQLTPAAATTAFGRLHIEELPYPENLEVI